MKLHRQVTEYLKAGKIWQKALVLEFKYVQFNYYLN